MENGIYFHRDLREGYHRKMQLSGRLRMQMKQRIRWQKWEWIVTWVWLCLLFVVVYSPSLIQSYVVPITKNKRGVDGTHISVFIFWKEEGHMSCCLVMHNPLEQVKQLDLILSFSKARGQNHVYRIKPNLQCIA